MTLDDLLALDRQGLGRALAAGHDIDPRALDDMEYRGVSLGLPGFVERLTWKTFQKVFHRDPETSRLRGWNVRIEQRGLDAPSVPLEKNGRPVTFGHYEVVGAPGAASPIRCDHGLLIDYGRGGNGRLDPTSRLRDPIVAVNAGSAALLLGWTYVDLGVKTVGTPSFFALTRERPLTHRVSPPSSPGA